MIDESTNVFFFIRSIKHLIKMNFINIIYRCYNIRCYNLKVPPLKFREQKNFLREFLGNWTFFHGLQCPQCTKEVQMANPISTLHPLSKNELEDFRRKKKFCRVATHFRNWANIDRTHHIYQF